MEHESLRREKEKLLEWNDKQPTTSFAEGSATTSITAILVFSIFTAVCGSFLMGSAVSYFQSFTLPELLVVLD